MAFCKKEMVLFFIVGMAALSVCMGGSEYSIGDDKGWNFGVNFTLWSEQHNVKVNDTIVFKYKKGEHNVVSVEEKDFKSCTVTAEAQKSEHNTGNDKITYTKNGHYYYVSSVKDDCAKGFKIHLRVSNTDGDKPNPSPTPKLSPAPPLPVATPPPSVPDKTPPPKETAPAPAPEKKEKNAAAISVSSLTAVGILAMGLAAFFGGFAY